LSSVSRGLSNIAKEILEDVEKEAETLILKAELQAKKILEEAEKEAEKRYKSIVEASKEKIEAERKEEDTLFEIEAKNRLLQVKEKIVDEVFERTLSRLREYVSTQDYENCLTRLIIEASKKINSKELIIQLNENDHRRLTEDRLEDISKEIGVKLVKSDRVIKCIGGVIVKSSNGKIVVNNTFENRLNMLKPVLRVKIAKRLFKEESVSQLKE